MIEKIVTNAQPGVGSAAFLAGCKIGVPIEGARTDDPDWIVRNVELAECTIWVGRWNTADCVNVAKAADAMGRPYRKISDLDDYLQLNRGHAEWLAGFRSANVAGDREVDRPGTTRQVMYRLMRIFKLMKQFEKKGGW